MTDDVRLETTERWPDLLAAIERGQTPAQAAAEYGVSRAALTGALRRTGTQGRRRIVRPPTPDGPEAPEASPGAPPATPAVERASRPSPGLRRVAKHHDRVGSVPDHVIATAAGVSVGTVRNYRKAHGIPGAPRSRSSRSPKRGRGRRPVERPLQVEPSEPTEPRATGSHTAERTAAPVQIVPSAPAPQVLAWRVEFASGQTRIAVGASLEDVAQRAEGADLGDVISLERVGIVFGG